METLIASLILTAAVASVATASGEPTPASTSKPNVVIILTDDHEPSHGRSPIRALALPVAANPKGIS